VDFGDHPEQTIIREFKEETGLDVIPVKSYKIYTYLSHNNLRHTVEIVYLVKLTNDNLKVTLSDEHDDFKWIDSSEIDSYKISEEMIDNLKKGFEQIYK
jgi:8-oxo-dGTP pyrophosphatase MutT (NUDIX family)